jgi:hypothetical protein
MEDYRRHVVLIDTGTIHGDIKYWVITVGSGFKGIVKTLKRLQLCPGAIGSIAW